MHDLWTEIPHDAYQPAKKKLKTRIQSACNIKLPLETLGPRKILVVSTNGADSVFEALLAEPAYDFQDPDFCTSYLHPINDMQYPQPRFAGLSAGWRARRPTRVTIRNF